MSRKAAQDINITIGSKKQKSLIWLKLSYFFGSFFGLLFFSLSFAQVSEATIIDNTDSGFSIVGFWQTYSSVPGFYGTNYRQTSGGGGKSATWTFQISTPGQYQISAQWTSSSNRATNAPYTIYNNGVNLGTVLVNQTINGGKFNLLGTFSLNSGTLQVVLTNNVSSSVAVVADAVQVTISAASGSAITTVIDNSDPAFTSIGYGFTTVGFWQTFSSVPGFYGTNYLQTTGSSGKSATWTFHIGTGQYNISARWTSSSNRATNAPYTIYNNGVNLGTVSVNQTINGGKFNLLGTFSLNSGILKVVLTNSVSSSVVVVADAVQISTSQGVTIVSPSDLDLKTSRSVSIKALTAGFPSNWGVKFIVKNAASGNTIAQVNDYTSPFQQSVTVPSLAEYTVDALIIDQNGTPQPPFSDHIRFGVGHYYVGLGDSITFGLKDDIVSDNISNDLRNGGGGYEPILNNKLTNNKGYPHTVINQGVSGNSSLDGLNRVSSVLSANPDSQYFLVQFGTNDAIITPPIPSGKGLNPGDPGYAGSYKDNMQQIITAIKGAGKTPLLAKVPIILGLNGQAFSNPDQAQVNITIQDYNTVVDELVSSNSIQVNGIQETPPDFYNFFRSNPNQISSDFIHPKGVGYQSMANLWFNVLSSIP